jgi:hypothetical protein
VKPELQSGHKPVSSCTPWKGRLKSGLTLADLLDCQTAPGGHPAADLSQGAAFRPVILRSLPGLSSVGPGRRVLAPFDPRNRATAVSGFLSFPMGTGDSALMHSQTAGWPLSAAWLVSWANSAYPRNRVCRPVSRLETFQKVELLSETLLDRGCSGR